MAASIYGSQVQSAAQSLAAYLQALQAKNAGNSAAATPGNTVTGTAATGAGGKGAKDTGQATGGSPLDVVTLSAEAQRLLANAQAPSSGPGSLATYLNTSNSQDPANLADAIGSDPFDNGYLGAIAQYKQWLSEPLGQPIPHSNDQARGDKTATQATTDAATVKPAGTTSS